jgi:soluble lytic murein transglycosylase
MYMAGEGGKKSPRQIMEAILTSESEDKINQISSEHSAARGSANTKYLAALNARSKYQRDSHNGPMGALTYGLDPAAYQRQMKILMDAEAAAKAEKEKADLGAQYVEAIKAEKKRLADNIAQIRSGSTLGSAVAGGDSLFDQLLQQESGGRHLDKYGNVITSSKGARGIAQLMPDTARNPGFGIEPVKDDSEAENRRVGRQYFDAMLARYGGDKQKALAAYNGGFAKVDSAVAKGGDNWLSLMPAETRNYVPSILSKIDGNSYGTPMPSDASTGGGRGNSSSYQELVVRGMVNVNTSDGKSYEVPLYPDGKVGAPTPQGVR